MFHNRFARSVALASIFSVFGFAVPTQGATDAEVCEHAARQAAQEFRIPKMVMQAITLTETGRTISGVFRPWPWTVNVEGKGEWLQTKQQAKDAVLHLKNTGTKNFDVGCFQINFRWHGHNFMSLEQMLDPRENARYAALFLRQLYQELGTWDDAAGAYHSRDAILAERYMSRFRPILANLEAPGSARRSRPDTTRQRQNNFPLLQGRAGGASRGSLFPSLPTAQRRLITPSGGRG